ncbi:bifunctional proline dehydrogenase/L-glutamate gamma-semialdehyde dehydrogenase PutA [Pseudorhodoplanes sp.]|uniref:bifunctional proline dehydrogenase/L-glutamate gamma-semialdehyde dehydrogenase PutA n=1 Tax=Pseudorhodoplanes sp. TaxID=1934341 RepID=UPI002C29294B|nr:bifunctional proline dehydrogenase/L-glutamate gamma-semialdehyde dehydrogenase PutA [Pseudorhodoplanes sp.]HWV52308.1 bifunctional proline dehydrogenase/L-glutamate gamma-semialdehyde dehydrogenase PutA [Pseudorhodoplanes sp.]
MAGPGDDGRAAIAAVPAFRAAYAPPDEDFARRFLTHRPPADADRRIDALATRLIEAIRSHAGGLGGIDDFLHAYSLSTQEGLALMVLAEALLRVPDAETTDRLIEDKLSGRDWSHPDHKGDTLLVSASAWTLGISARLIAPGETPENLIEGLARRLGVPALRLATRQAMRLLGSHFVHGQTIGEALARAASDPEQRYSFDMLGEGARTGKDAERYLQSYTHAIEEIGKSSNATTLQERPGISVKLSALHPRYEAVSQDRVRRELGPRLLELARKAKAYDLPFTVDAEEADRLELSLAVIGDVLRDPSLAGWDGFGLAVQAYQKRAGAVIQWLGDAAQALSRRLMVRLVKGAYWDTEVKRAQERGLSDYPVFTRKAMTDLCYMECVSLLLKARPRLYPQFATHNALTVASVIEEAGGVSDYEFQRLHGMGVELYDALRAEYPDVACRVYAPVGGHRDLLAYLVRRLLENGANTSFVSVSADPKIPIETILMRPRQWIASVAHARHSKIPLPRDLYAPDRKNSPGVEFGDRAALRNLLADIAEAKPVRAAQSIVDGKERGGAKRPVISPSTGDVIGEVSEADAAVARDAMAAAQAGFAQWSATPVLDRARILDHAGDLLEQRRGVFIALLQSEGGKTLDDCVAEWREAIDYCRYYAAQARKTLVPQMMPGPTGETNELRYRGRGVFVCIAPWNFPLAIFIGQVSAALAAGNGVVAKPAEQTPLVAYQAIRLLHEAGIPPAALHLVLGDGKVGAALVEDPRVAGVAFTGSTEVGRIINRALAAKDGPIVPFIAETGGVNAMIVDATALPEQVTDDAVGSVFRSAGQRCSALRLLCVQEQVADHIFGMVAGAAATLTLGDPHDPATHVGPVIDAESKERLDGWIARHETRIRYRWDRDHALPARGLFVPPTIIELQRASDLQEEVFGPILHVVRFHANDLRTLLDDIESNGTGLTLGIHSRIDARVAEIANRLANGNVYVNRNMVGAVVGTQPFGGTRLSGTGPKAGGPNYLRRFATEQVIAINTAASGGNASLFAVEE